MTTTPAALEGASQPRPGLQERISDAITDFCGHMLFVYVHTLAFGIWIGTSGFGHDSFPFNFLTMAVSLEAIFLSTFILISQNRQQAIAETNNKLVQKQLLQMLDDVISDEKLDLKNEQMIGRLLRRMDVEHIKPIASEVSAVHAAVARIEAAIAGAGG